MLEWQSLSNSRHFHLVDRALAGNGYVNVPVLRSAVEVLRQENLLALDLGAIGVLT
jgi:hypothetical protein